MIENLRNGDLLRDILGTVGKRSENVRPRLDYFPNNVTFRKH